MKTDDHIHFLSDLLYQLDQLTALVRDYCDEMITTEDDEYHCQMENEKNNNMPF
ncbi:MAG: hypothetical protein V2I36_14650 [Desulfopila sp.]|jgi:hypothetical protein|nr:hypothetical protein [Desulfopila sp.]